MGLGLLGALAWYFFGTGQPAAEENPMPANVPVVKREEPKRDVEPVSTKVDLPAVPDSTKLSTDLTGVFTSLTDLLGGVKDVPTAETAAPKLTELNPRIDDLKALWDKVPARRQGHDQQAGCRPS